MGRIYTELGPIPIPAGCGINRHDGRVFIKFKKNGGAIGRHNIGKMAGEGMMHPNEYFRFKFPDKWEELTGEKTPPYELKIGLYLVFLSIA